jgi:hypothetical protein
MESASFPPQISNWTPLIDLVGKDLAQDFMFVGNAGNIMVYKHCMTRRHLNIHISTGQTYRYDCDCGYISIVPEVAVASVIWLGGHL